MTIDGDTIDVKEGTYVENVRINKELTLRSFGGGTVTIEANGDPGIHIYGNNTVVSGISVRNASNATASRQ